MKRKLRFNHTKKISYCPYWGDGKKERGTMQKKTTIIGCGDIGLRVSSLYRKENQLVRGFVRSRESLDKCLHKQIEAYQFDMDFQSSKTLAVEKHDLYYFAPPPVSGDKDRRLQKFLEQLSTIPRKIVLISTTGVYGDCAAEWIDETQQAKPKADRAKRRFHAEQSLQVWSSDNKVAWVILRVPGIYALDRLPLARIKKGTPMVRGEEAGWTNRIHADDLAMIAKAVMQDPNADGQIYNACDGNPSVMTHYFDQVADYANLPRPPKITMAEAEKQLSSGILSYLKESRKISNRKLLQELKITLKYPDLMSCLGTYSKK